MPRTVEQIQFAPRMPQPLRVAAEIVLLEVRCGSGGHKMAAALCCSFARKQNNTIPQAGVAYFNSALI